MELVQGIKVGIIEAWGEGGAREFRAIGSLGFMLQVCSKLKYCVEFVCKGLASKFGAG